MANISINQPNFVYLDNFFYTIDSDNDLLLKVTFDGAIAFCFNLDVAIDFEVKSLVYDGVYFWSLEHDTGRVIIRRWLIADMMCKQQDKFEYVATVSEVIDAYSFAVEAYTLTLSSDLSSGQSSLTVSDASHISPGNKLLLGPNIYDVTEKVVVDHVTGNVVYLTTNTVNGYSAGEYVRFYKYGYMFNNASGADTTIGSLYKIDLRTGSVINKTSSTKFLHVTAADTAVVSDRNGSGVVDYDGNGSKDVFYGLLAVKGNIMFILDLYDTGFRTVSSMLLSQQPNVGIYDITVRSSTIYLLESGYDYKVAQFDAMVASVSVSAYPSILPADGVSSSTITVTVLNQYNEPIVGKIVRFEVTSGSLSSDTAITNSMGVANVSFTSGTTVGTVTIKATVSQN